MISLSNWNDINSLKIGDEINFANKKNYKINSKDIDQDIGGIRIILTLHNGKEVIINHLGEASGDLGVFNLSDDKLKKISSGGKRKTLRRHYKKSNYRKSKAKKTRRRYK